MEHLPKEIKIEKDIIAKEFKKKYSKKIYEIYECLYTEGLEFYSFTIMYSGIIKGDDGQYASGSEKAKTLIDKQIENIVEYALKQIPYIENVYISVEYHKGDGDLKGYPHFHGIMAVNSIIGGIGYNIYLNIKKLIGSLSGVNVFLNINRDFDVKINYLKTWKDVYQSLNYVIKEYIFANQYIYWFQSKDDKVISHYTIMKELGGFLDHEICCIDGASFLSKHESLYDILFFRKIKVLERGYIEKYKLFNKNRFSDKSGIIALINSYMEYKNFYYNKNNIYTKILGSQSSYAFKCRFETFLSNFRETVDEMLEDQNIRFQLEYFNLYDYIFEQSIIAREIIRKDPKLLIKHISMNNDICEFSDGFYLIKEDSFIYLERYKKELDFLLNKGLLNTTRHYPMTYHNLSLPEFWLSCIKNNLIEDEKEVISFCRDFGMLFHEKGLDINTKKNNLYIEGDSNTGKTSLVAKVLIGIHGEENVGMVGNSNNFAFEQAIEKLVLICDEFVYSKKKRSDYLKILDNSLVLVDKKHKAGEIIKNKAKALFLANSGLNEEFLNDQAVNARLVHYRFRNAALEDDPGFQRKINSEIPKILVYCNKLYVKSQQKKKFYIKNYFNKLLKNDKKDDKKKTKKFLE